MDIIPISTLKKSDPLLNMLFSTANAKAFMRRKYRRIANHVLPGLDAGDINFRKFCRELGDQYDRTFSHKTEKDFFLSDSLPEMGGRLLNVSGVGPRNTGYVDLQNAQLRQEFGLRTSVDVADLAIFDELLLCMFHDLAIVPLKINDKSSSGAPMYAFDRESKIQYTRMAFQQFDDVIKALNSNDGTGLLKMGLSTIYTQNFRLSADVNTKKRTYADLIGNRHEVDRSVDGFDADLGISCRARHVFGLNNTMNNLIACWLRPREAVYLRRFAFTWKHRTPELIAADLNDFLKEYPRGIIKGVDVANFDKTVPDYLLELFVNRLMNLELLSAEGGTLFTKCLKGLVFHPQPGMDEEACLLGNPYTLEGVEGGGLLSGVYLVSTLGKFFNVFDVLCNLRRCGHDFTGKVELFLKGKLNIRIKNMGDDGLIMFPTAQDASKYFDISKNGYFKSEVEQGLVFLGNLYCLEGNVVTTYPNLRSKLINTFVSEKDYRSKFRRDYFWIGLVDQVLLGGKHPLYPEMDALLNYTFRKYFGRSWSGYIDKIIEMGRGSFSQWSDYDLIFITNPDSIHYKIDAEDVTPALLDQFFQNIEWDEYSPITAKLGSINILNLEDL